MAQLKKVHYCDLLLLRDLFCGEEYGILVYDPLSCVIGGQPSTCTSSPEVLRDHSAGKVVFNFSFDLFPHDLDSAYIFHFQADHYFRESTYEYIHNPDGTIRWIYPLEMKKPYFLELYNNNTLRGKLYRHLIQLAFSGGLRSRIASGSFFLQQKSKNRVEQVITGSSADMFSIFTGTKGENRKSIISLHRNAQTTHFIKMAFDETPRKLIINESQMLTTLSKYDFTALSLPQPSRSIDPNFSKLTNVKPGVFISANRLRDVHIRALDELYESHHEYKCIRQSTAWETISNQLHLLDKEHEILNDLDATMIYGIIKKLFGVFNGIDAKTEIPVSFAHGDFTPWNMYTDDHRLYVYDWELAGAGMPMLMDLFHFIYQSQVLLFRKDYPTIARHIREVMGNALTLKIINRYKIDTDLHYRLYLLFTVTYYIRLYIHQKPLHSQAHWLVNTWHQALNDLSA